MPTPTDMTSRDLKHRAADVRKEIELECIRIEDGFIKLAQLLLETVENGYFVRWGFSSFEEFATTEIGIGYRKANYLVGIAQIVKSLGIPWKDVEGIGWTKMRTLVPIIKQEGGVGDWLDLARELSVKDLEKLVKDAKIGLEVGSSGGDAVVTLKFRVTKEQSDIIMDALTYAKKATETEDDVMALEQMAFDYIMSSSGEPEKLVLEDFIAMVENKFGVEITIENRKDIGDLLDEAQASIEVEQ